MVADAIHIVEVPPLTVAPAIVDNADAAYAEIGSNWLGWSESGAYKGDFRYHAAGTGQNAATWTFADLAPGQCYEVFATWSPQSNRATDAPYTMLDDTSALGTVRVNQQLTPSDSSADNQGWQSLGLYQPSSGTLRVELTDDASSGYVIADAVRVVPVTLYWDPDGNPANDNIATGAGLGGDGTATADSGNVWYDPLTGRDVPWVERAQAVFTGSGGTVTLDSNFSPSGITVASGDFTLQGGAVQSLTGQLPIEVDVGRAQYRRTAGVEHACKDRDGDAHPKRQRR